MLNNEALETAIMKILTDDFRGVELLRVNVTPDTDFDGDDILRVEVIFSGEPRDIKPGLITKATRALMPKLSKMEGYAFPSMSFIAEKNAELAAS